MSYIITTPAKIGTGIERKIDERQFAVDLAKELGGNVELNTFQNDSIFIVLDDMKLFVHADNWKKRVIVSVHSEYGTYEPGTDNQRLQNASINPEARPIASIAKDIRKRVIEANAPALAARRAWAEAKAKAASDLGRYAEELTAAIPGVAVEMKEGEVHEARIRATGLYLYGRLSSSGKVTIDRIESLPLDKFVRIMAIVSEGVLND